MSKKNVNTKSKKLSKCQCSTCEQVAFAQEGTQHFYCKGINPRILSALPDNLKGITNPSKKGTWKDHAKVLEAALQEETNRLLRAMEDAEQEILTIQEEIAV